METYRGIYEGSCDKIIRLRRISREERRQTIGNLNKGNSLSAENRALISDAAKRRKPMSVLTTASRLKCAVRVRPLLITCLRIT